MIRTDDVTQDDRVIPVRLLAALPWINLCANRWRRRWRHKRSLATSLATALATALAISLATRGVAGNHDKPLMIFVTIMNQDITIAKLQKEEEVDFALPLEGGNIFQILARFEVELHESWHWLVGGIQKLNREPATCK